jgi:hypothetical protein
MMPVADVAAIERHGRLVDVRHHVRRVQVHRRVRSPEYLGDEAARLLRPSLAERVEVSARVEEIREDEAVRHPNLEGQKGKGVQDSRIASLRIAHY